MAVSCAPFGPSPQFELASGAPNVGGLLFFYVGGSTNTKQDTFTSSTGATPNTNPIVLDALGMPTNTQIWFTSGLFYKVVYAPAGDTDPPSSPIRTWDNLSGIENETVSLDQWKPSGQTPTFVSSTEFTLVGDQTTEFHRGRRLKTALTAGTGYHTITGSAFALGLTTVTVNGTALDSGLSAAQIGLLSSTNSAVPGVLLVGKLSSNLNTEGTEIDGIDGLLRATRTSNPPIEVNRLSTDGTLVLFYKDGGLQGSISVAGATVSYNAFLGSHWSQLHDGSRPDIPRGTVLSTIDELCEWSDNEKMPKVKISDTAGDPRVYGVFLAWDNDYTETNDMYVASVGTFLVRMHEGQPLRCGLIESAGDGTARFQEDDVYRISTLGKITAAVVVEKLEDGSFLMPCKLDAG